MMVEKDDVLLLPPEPIAPQPSVIDKNNSHSEYEQDTVTEKDQTKLNQDFIELGLANGSNDAVIIAESVVNLVIDRAISLVTNELKEVEDSSGLSISDNGIKSNLDTVSDNTAGNLHDPDVNEDKTVDQGSGEDQPVDSDNENLKSDLTGDESSLLHICSTETEVEEEKSEGSFSGSLTKLEDTFSIDKSQDQTNMSDLPSDELAEYSAVDIPQEDDAENTNTHEDANKSVKETEPPAKVNINVLNALYFPTKLVNGYVSISRDYDITSLTLSLICEGNQSITWINTKSSKGSEAKINQNSEKIIESQLFFTDYVDLVHQESSDHERLKFAFSYQFPPNLPSSFSYVQNDEKDIFALIEYSFILLDIKENQIIAKKTINMYEAPPYHYLTKPKKDSMKIFYLTCINKGTVTLKAELDKGCYFVGDKAQIRCCIENGASEKISEVGVYLCRHLHFKDRKFNQWKVRHVLSRQKYYELEGKWSGKSHGAVLPFEITEVGTQSVYSSQFINCFFIIRVAMKTKSGYDLFVDLDVVVYNPNENSDKMIVRGNGYEMDPHTSPGQNSDFKQDNNSSSSNSSLDSDNTNENEMKNGVAPNKKIVDSDQYPSSRKSSNASVEYPKEHDSLQDQIEISSTKKDEDASSHCVTKQDAQENSQPKRDNLEVELPRFPEDYLPSTGDVSEDLSVQDVIVQL